MEHDPREIGGYLLEGRLGAGGMGVVYRARSVSGRRVAVKVIRPELAADAEFRARFRQEVTAARKVSGAFTAPVLDADADAPAPWLATLFIPGPSLGERVADQGPLTPPEVRRLAAGLAEALQAIHRVGLIHRDLKPGNVLLAEDGPRVIDFGIARSVGESPLTSTGVAVGTPPFMAPEQFRSGTATPATDVFALGSVLVFAATGRSPFGADSSHAVGYRVVHEEPSLTGLAAELRPLIAACLAKEPEQRPTVEALLGMVAAGVPKPTVRLRTGPVLPAAPAPTARATVVPTPAASAPPAVVPAPVPPADRPGKAMLMLVALAVAGFTLIGSLGFLSWWILQPDGGPDVPLAESTGVICAPAGKATIGTDGMAAALLQQWKADFAKTCPADQLTLDTAGAAVGTATDRFANGGLDAVAVDTAPSDGQAGTYAKHCATGRAVQLPVTVLPVAVVFNVPGVSDLTFDAPTLAKVFRGTIRTWNDPAIRALNPMTVLPNSPIAVRVPSGASWSTFVFTQYLAKAAPADWPVQPGTAWQAEPPLPPGPGASGLPADVRATQGSIGFVPLRDVGTLRTARVRTADTDAEASPASASIMAETGTVNSAGGRVTVTLDYRQPVRNGYPIVEFGYLDFCEQGEATPVMAAFASYAVSIPAQMVGDGMRYGALPTAVAQKAQGALADLRSK
ncbi:serine/threonine-protein kinase [Kitasatospora sp. NPDC093558]|uniref:serine/threonine-protein kinase n=1 Tax=Kitasatospora sp. NPDC093558 TaxID=3155201 RepID=UPI0034302FE0